MVSSSISDASKKPDKRSFNLKYRLVVLYRFFLAILGGYTLAVLTSIVVGMTFPAIQASAVMSATMLAFIVHCCVFIWVFAVNSTLKASLGVIIPTIVLFILFKFIKG